MTHCDVTVADVSMCSEEFCKIQLYLLRCIRPEWPTSQMADGILKFMIGHLGLGSNVQLGLVDFSFVIGQLRLVLIGQQDFKVSDEPIETGLKWPAGF